ncbi:MAG: dihydrolipoamide acetyltransferase family protein [Candidatus Brocadiaceae bacterium]|jgi:pyruvate dehydrogenase E2 component (dihydrolipoamide acetyltransferase)
MLQRVFLPQLGQTMEEGTIERWHKQEGDAVEKGEVLYELTTDKATLEVESFASGVLRKVLVPEGQTVAVNELIAVIGDPDEEIPEELLRRPEEAPGAVEAPEVEPGAPVRATAEVAAPAGKPIASPRARKIAREQKVPLEAVQGTGPGGRIIERDVLAYAEQTRGLRFTPAARELAFQQGVDLRAVAQRAGDRRVRVEDVQEAPRAAAPGRGREGERVPLSPMRRTIAERMSESQRAAPHFYLVGEVEMDAAVELLRELNEATEQKVTVTTLLVKAVGLALAEHPQVNARFGGDAILLNDACNVGVAVAVEDGLFVPVIRDAERKGLAQIASELRGLAEAAREGRLRPDQYEGGSITLSNLGMYGIDSFQAIINPPESCIIGIGAIKEQPVARNGGLAVSRMMKVSISADHRVVNGAEVAEFFGTLSELLEEPERLRG